MTKKLEKSIAALLGAAFVFNAAPAFAGQWKLDRSRCPDLVEDRIDRAEDWRDTRITWGPRDAIEDHLDWRENKRDERVTVCPARAFYYKPGKGNAPRAVLPLRWDARAKLHYRYDNGQKIFVRL